ncbi:MAG: hypothetical protein GKR89_20510 [Candidatus Latescibacteria bacterium]|nr:hypothetical protein [Candidatus Latescibacterota bacterium]
MHTLLRTALLALLLAASSTQAQRIRFDSVQSWSTWQLPGAVELTAAGQLRTLAARKNINATLNAGQLGGGIRKAGSNPLTAALVMDGDPDTGWNPNPADATADWFIEVDLGRAVTALRLHLVFAADAPPFALFDVLLSTGEAQVDDVGNALEGTLVYRQQQRFKENNQHRVTFELDQPEHTPIQFVRIENLLHIPGARLAEVEVEAVGDNLALRLPERGGDVDMTVGLNRISESVPLGNSRALVDGSLPRRMSFGATPGRGAEDIDAHIILDLGAVYPIDQVRLVSGVVLLRGSRRRWEYKYYEIMTSDGSLAPNGTRIWTKHFTGRNTPANQSRGMADHHFAPIPARFVRLLWKFWDGSCATALGGDQGATTRTCQARGAMEEIQVFGQGFPDRAVLRSPLLDLGQANHAKAIHWGAQTPPGTQVEVRSRTGNELDFTIVYHDKNGKEVTPTRYEKLIPSFRGAIDTTAVPGGDWSPWSRLYLQSGEGFQSPSPRRFMELEVALVSTGGQGAVLDFVEIETSPPLAEETRGEIFPVQVQPGMPTSFTYFVRPLQVVGRGFDQLAVEASTPLVFDQALVAGQPLDVAAATTDSGFVVTMPRRLDEDLVELRFSSAVFLDGTRFAAFIGDSRDGTRQRVDPGDATPQVESSTNIVRLPLESVVVSGLELDRQIISPNGDSRNDQVEIHLNLVNVLADRPLRLRIVDVAGQQVWSQEAQTQSGPQTLRWGGHSNDGRLVPPGLYLLEISFHGDAGTQTELRSLSVVY